MPFSFFLAFKYLKPKRSLASVITCVSITGVMLGVAIVVIVRAVMTGFGDLWKEKILDFKPHLQILSASPRNPVVYDEAEIVEAVAAVPGISAVSPEIDTRILLSYKSHVSAPYLLGLDPDAFPKMYKIGPPVDGTYDLDGDSIVLGYDLARSLGVMAGDEVVVYSPKTLASRDEVYLPVKWKVKGIFSTGKSDYDSQFAVTSLATMRDFMGVDDGVYLINVKTDEPEGEAFEKTVKAVRKAAGDVALAKYRNAPRIVTWQESDREIFNALAVEKNMMALLLMFITVVAIFCVMNTLLVLTVQKTAEIGLLKALGFGDMQIMGAFVVHGMVQCLTGVLLGLGAAVAILRNLESCVEMLRSAGVEVFPKAVYGLDSLPYRLVWSDVLWVVAAVFVFGVAASLVPAWVAARKKPVEALSK